MSESTDNKEPYPSLKQNRFVDVLYTKRVRLGDLPGLFLPQFEANYLRRIRWDSRWSQLMKVTATGDSSTGTYRPFGLGLHEAD